MKIEKLETAELTVPLQTTFTTACHRTESAHVMLVRITTEDGQVGYGEGTPYLQLTGSFIEGMQAAVKQILAPLLVGEDITQLGLLQEKLQSQLAGHPAAKAAVEMALYDLWSQHYQAPLYRLLGAYRTSLTTDITISLAPLDEMVVQARRAMEQGFKILKIKLGLPGADDVAIVQHIRAAVGPNISLRLDANQGWRPKQAVHLLEQMHPYDITFVEQPVARNDLAGLAYVREHAPIEIMADESACDLNDVQAIIKSQAADLVNIKLMKCGGLQNARAISTLCQSAGIACMLGCMVETKVAITAAAHLAATIPNIKYFDLDSPCLLAHDPVQGGIVYHGDHIELPTQPGLGVKGITAANFV